MRKFLLLSLLLLATQAAFAGVRTPERQISCVVEDQDKKYDDIFVVELRADAVSTLSYQRKSAKGYGALRAVEGCHDLLQHPVADKPWLISLECDNEGEDGSVEINSDTGAGELYFYKAKIGYPERTLLKIQCQ